jgi:nitrite reductase (NO-forming)
LTEQDKVETWDLVMAGGTHGRVGRQVGRHTSVVANLIGSTGGVRRPARSRAADRLSLLGREDIAVGVAGAAAWHGVALVQLLRAALPARFGATVRYYVAAAGLLPVGAVLGSAVLTTAAAALLGSRPLIGLGLAGYLAGLVVAARPFAATARRHRPSSYPTWSVLAGTLWYAACVAVLSVLLATAPSWPEAEDRLLAVTPFLAAGFLAQVLLGALSYLVPSVLGGGAAGVRAGNEVVERAGALRVVTVNASLLVCALPVPGAVRDVAAALALAGLASFLPLMLIAVRATRRARIAAGT